MEKAIKGTAEGGSKASGMHRLGEDETEQQQRQNRVSATEYGTERGESRFAWGCCMQTRKTEVLQSSLAAGFEREVVGGGLSPFWFCLVFFPSYVSCLSSCTCQKNGAVKSSRSHNSSDLWHFFPELVEKNGGSFLLTFTLVSLSNSAQTE